MAESTVTERFDRRNRGNRIGYGIFRACVRFLGLKGAYGLLYIVSLHYLLFDPDARTVTGSYLRHRFPDRAGWKRWRDIYRLFVMQGKMLVDRFAVISGAERLDIRCRGMETLEEANRDPRKGFILLTSHTGNWQACMSGMGNLGRRVHLVMREEDNPVVQETLRLQIQGNEVRIISPESFLGGTIEIMSRLREGDVVSIMGDRNYGHSAVEVSFLGDRALFPAGAFHIAAMVECPILVLMSAKLSTREYVLGFPKVFHPRYEAGKDRTAQLTDWVQEYVGILESFIQENPYQCFIFHDVWEKRG